MKINTKQDILMASFLLVSAAIIVVLAIIRIRLEFNFSGFNLWMLRDPGSVADWVSALLSMFAILVVFWQVNREIKNEKELRKEYSRPFFSINIIFNFKDNIRTYIPDNGDIDVLRKLDKEHIKMRGENLYYCSNYSIATPLIYLSRIFLISNPSTKPLLYVRISIYFTNKEKEQFWVGRINAAESIQILPDLFIKRVNNKKFVDDNILRVEKVILLYTTISNEKFISVYKYVSGDLERTENRKISKKDYYDLYFFNPNPYIIFKPI